MVKYSIVILTLFLATWASLDKDRNGKPIRRIGDYTEGQLGQTQEPVLSRDLFSFTVMHKWAHSLHHKVRIVIHDMIGLHEWTETGIWKEDVKEAKKIIQDVLAPGRVPGGSREKNIGRNNFGPVRYIYSISTCAY